jgi:hypothetical protein
MKRFQLKNLLFTVTILSVLSACKKDKVEPTPPETTPERAGVYVLNEGNINANNSTLTYYNYLTKATVADQFSAVNATKIGDTGNDVQVYGSKMYIVVNVSSTIEVVNAKTTKSIKQIKMLNGTTARQPRFIVFDKNKAFISLYDGNIAVMDTATLAIEKYIPVGRNPEQMVISNGKLYVANSGGLDSFTAVGPDKTVSVINLTTLTETKKITVPANPINVSADAFGDVYVTSYGTDYPSKPFLTIISNTTDVVRSSNSFDAGYASSLVVNGDLGYYLSDKNTVKIYNVKNDVVVSENFITDGTTITSPYDLAVDKTTGEIFVADAKDYSSNGSLYAFNKTGKIAYTITTGINPGAIVFVNK